MAKSKSKGFSVLEILMVMAIIGIAVSIVIVSFSKLNEKQALDKSADLAVSILNEARSLTLSSVEAAQYGVHFDDGQLVLFQGNSYSEVDSDNVITLLNALVGVRNVNLSGGGNDVVFNRLTGSTNQSGSLELFLKNATTSFRAITINGTGVAEED